MNSAVYLTLKRISGKRDSHTLNYCWHAFKLAEHHLLYPDLDHYLRLMFNNSSLLNSRPCRLLRENVWNLNIKCVKWCWKCFLITESIIKLAKIYKKLTSKGWEICIASNGFHEGLWQFLIQNKRLTLIITDSDRESPCNNYLPVNAHETAWWAQFSFRSVYLH